jgi:PilZ domain
MPPGRRKMLTTLERDLKISSESSSAERRRYIRYPFTGSLEAFEPTSQTRIQGRTADLSEGGCYVDTMSPFPAKTHVRMRITREKRSFESQATVVYSVAGMGMGLRFDASDPKQFATLKKWLGELSGELPVESQIDEKNAATATLACSTSVLSELISELMRKGVLDEEVGRAMFQRLASAN